MERKFLVINDDWRNGAVVSPMVQGYLSRDPERIVRVRVCGELAFMTVKGKATGISRTEIEFAIPLAEGQALLALCLLPLIEKNRHVVVVGEHRWEIDEFRGASAGLIVAEIELGAEDEEFVRPSWIGREVSSDYRYANSYLSEHAFGGWKDEK